MALKEAVDVGYGQKRTPSPWRREEGSRSRKECRWRRHLLPQVLSYSYGIEDIGLGTEAHQILPISPPVVKN
jgi:hypothetical protein